MELISPLSSLSSAILIISIILNIFLGYIVFRSNVHSATNRLFALLTVSVSIWMAVFFVSLQPFDPSISIKWIRWSLLVTVPVNTLFFLLAYTFPYDKLGVQRGTFWTSITLTILTSVLTTSPYTFTSVTIVENFPVPTAGAGLAFFALFVLSTNSATIYEMTKRWRGSTGELKTQIGYLLLGTLLFLLLMFGTVLIPTLVFQNVSTVPLAPLYTLIFIATTTYASFRHHLFNVKVIATQAFVAILCIVFFARIFTGLSASERIFDTIIFVATFGFGILLIRSVKQEVKAREEIRTLADELAKSNTELASSNERLRIMDQRKSEFVSIASHQLRTPVTAMKGYASLLLEDAYGELSAKAKEPIAKIFHSSERLALMITDFLNVSKIEQGSMTYDLKPLDLRRMLVDLVEDFHVAAGEKKLNVKTDIPDEKFPVIADAGKFRQIISNLLDNAIKYTPEGEVRVSLRREPTHGEHGMILLQIKDTGIGLSQDDIHHLFGKFTRGSEGQKVNTTGSGLGLYVAKKMMEEHKGNIWVESEGKGKGSVFLIELPEFHGELPKEV